MENMNSANRKLILIRGLPGSGKSTVAGFIYNAARLETDKYWYVDGVYKFDASKLNAAHKWCQAECIYFLNAGVWDVVVSNTFTTKKELKPYFEIAKRFGIIPTVIVCQNNFGNTHHVPEETLIKMKNRWEDNISELFEEIK